MTQFNQLFKDIHKQAENFKDSNEYIKEILL